MLPRKELLVAAGAPASVERYIRAKLARLAIPPELAEDLYMEAVAAVWQAAQERATGQVTAYFVKTAWGAIQHFLRDRANMTRIPTAWSDRGERPVPVLLCERMEKYAGTVRFEDELIEEIVLEGRIAQVKQASSALPPKQREQIGAAWKGIASGHVARNSPNNRTVAIRKLRARFAVPVAA